MSCLGWCSLLDKLQNWIYRTVGPNPWIIVEMWPAFGRCSSELAQLVPLPFSRGRSTRYSDRLHDFSVTIPKCYKDVYVNSFFPSSAHRMLSFDL